MAIGRCRCQPRSLRGASELSSLELGVVVLLDGLLIGDELVSVLGLVLEGVDGVVLVSVDGVVVLVGGVGWVVSVVCAKAIPPTTARQAAAMPVRR